MKSDIHPAYHAVNAVCSCGHQQVVHTTLNRELHLDICSKCHPFYTGQQKIVDTAGRVERFKAKFARKKAVVAENDTKA